MGLYNNPPYYLSAYGMAVKHGYKGTEEEFVRDIYGGAARADIKAEMATQEAAVATQKALDSEAYGAGTRAGETVDSEDPAYHNNAMYYAQASAGSADAADGSAEDSEAYAIGKRDGTDVDSDDPAYHNNSKYYAGVAKDYADNIADPISGIVTGWLDDHVDPDTGYVIDDTLLIEDAAADAKATGEAIGDLKSAIAILDDAVIGGTNIASFIATARSSGYSNYSCALAANTKYKLRIDVENSTARIFMRASNGSTNISFKVDGGSSVTDKVLSSGVYIVEPVDAVAFIRVTDNTTKDAVIDVFTNNDESMKVKIETVRLYAENGYYTAGKISENMVEEVQHGYQLSDGAISAYDGSVVAASGNKYVALNCRDFVKFTYYTTAYGSNYGIAFFDENDTFILGIKTTSEGLNSFDVPPKAASIKFSSESNNWTNGVKIFRYKTADIDILKNNMYIQNVQVFPTVLSGAVSSVDGSIISNSDLHAEMNCSGWSSFTYFTHGFGSNYGIAFFDKDNNFISAIKTTSRAFNTFNVPYGAETVKFCWTNSEARRQKITVTGIVSNQGYYLHKKQIENLEDKTTPYLPVYCDSSLEFTGLYRYINGLKIRQEIGDQNISFGISGNGNHDGTMVIKDGYAYCVFMSNSGSGDNASSDTATVRLCKVKLSDPTDRTIYTVAENGATLGSYTEAGGAGSPNMILVGNTLHILFAVHLADYYAIMHCTFNTETSTLANYDIVTLDGDILNNAKLNSMFGYSYTESAFNNMQANAQIAYDGEQHYYIGLCWGYGTGKSIIVKTDDLVNWEFETDVDFGITPVFELALHYKSGYLYAAQRPMLNPNDTTGNLTEAPVVGILCKYDISNKEFIDKILVPNCGSRPDFFEYDGTIYLLTNPHSRSFVYIVSIATGNLLNSQIVAESRGGWNYPDVYVSGQDIYFITSGNDIALGKMTLDNIDGNDIDNFFASLIN